MQLHKFAFITAMIIAYLSNNTDNDNDNNNHNDKITYTKKLGYIFLKPF